MYFYILVCQSAIVIDTNCVRDLCDDVTLAGRRGGKYLRAGRGKLFEISYAILAEKTTPIIYALQYKSDIQVYRQNKFNTLL